MENQEEINPPDAGKPLKKRPSLLKVICILTFAGSGMMFISFLMAGLFHDLMVQMSKMPQYQMPGMDMITASKAWVFLAGAALYCLSLSGAFLMWKLKKPGFHLYTISQFGLIYLSSFYLFPGRFPTSDIVFSGTFVLLYATFLRDMK